MERRNRFLQGVGALLHGNWRSKTCFFVFGCLLDVRAKNVEIARDFPQKNCERSFLGHPFLSSSALVALNRGMALSS